MENNTRDPRNTITGAVILIFIGIIFVLRQLGIQNWWALFILIPAISSLSTLVQDTQNGTATRKVITQGVLNALFPTAIAGMFLFNLDWAIFWPIFIILAGLSMLLTGFIQVSGGLENLVSALKPWLISWGFGVMLVGGLFLVQTLHIYDLSAINQNWWGVPILVAASGGLLAALIALRNNENLKAGANLITAVTLAIPGLFALFGLNTEFVLPLLIIAVGLSLLISFFGNSRKNNP